MRTINGKSKKLSAGPAGRNSRGYLPLCIFSLGYLFRRHLVCLHARSNGRPQAVPIIQKLRASLCFVACRCSATSVDSELFPKYSLIRQPGCRLGFFKHLLILQPCCRLQSIGSPDISFLTRYSTEVLILVLLQLFQNFHRKTSCAKHNLRHLNTKLGLLQLCQQLAGDSCIAGVVLPI